jgi:hypothetical protein
MATLLNQGYYVTMDNWFPSPELHSKLCSRLTPWGTLHQNKSRVPDEIKKAKLKKKETMWQYKLILFKWKDKDIHLVSNTHDEKLVQIRV